MRDRPDPDTDAEAPPPEAELTLTVAELDGLIAEHMPADEDVENPLRAGYHAGRFDTLRELHEALIETAAIHTPDTE